MSNGEICQQPICKMKPPGLHNLEGVNYDELAILTPLP